MHPSAASAHTATAERERFDQNYCGLVRQVQQATKKVFHIFYVLRDPFVVDSQLHEHEIGGTGDVKGEAE